jgi:hypothetical protein
MAFNVEISFTGICAFIPNQDSTRDVKMCVALPDVRGEKSLENPNFVRPPASSFARKRLKRHMGFMNFSPADLSAVDAGKVSDDLVGTWLLDKHRVVIKASGAPNPYENHAPLADLGKVAPGLNVDTDLVSETPRSVVAQVLIDQGLLNGASNLGSWTFPTTLSGGSPEARAIASEVVLSLKDLDKFSLQCTSIIGDTTKDRTWEFHRNSGTVKIVIANLCDENPLRWPTTKEEAEPDEDFELYYELLFNAFDRFSLQGKLLGLSLPIPFPATGAAAGNGQGVNCVPAQTGPVSYNVDHLR